MERRRRGRVQRSRTTDFSSSPPGPSFNSDPHQLLQILQGFLQEERIREKLAEATVNRDLKAERFITHKSVERIWKWDILKRFLEILGFENDDTLVELVTKGLLKTLSILVAIRWQMWHLFKTTFLEDGEGPLRTLRHDRNDGAIPYSLENLEDDAFLGKDWAEDFLLAQYTYIPIVVEQGGNEIFPRTRPLPFIRSKSKEIAKGGYGVVTKEVIACHQFRPLLDYTSNDLNAEELPVARKWFSAKGDFRKEARNLAKLNSSLSDHKRIVKYLAVITIGDEQDQGSSKEFNILLPLADTDLKHFLYDPKYEKKCRGVKDLINECAQLSDAVRFLHNGLTIDGKVLICCHMDLKLDNILVYFNSSSPVGCWKNSDFGISSMSRREDIQITPTQPAPALLEVPSPAQSLARITNTVRTNAKRPPGPFSAPEVELGNEVGRSSDIWSFGCILFQVLARAAGGISLLNGLDEKRATKENGSRNDHFCQQTAGKKYLHHHVCQWLQSSNSLCDGSLTDRIAVMNCKHLILKTLSIAPEDRPDAGQLHGRLVQIANGDSQPYHFDQHSNMIVPSVVASAGPQSPQLAPITPPIHVTCSVPSIPEYAPENNPVPRSDFPSLPLVPSLEPGSPIPEDPPNTPVPTHEPQHQARNPSSPDEIHNVFSRFNPSSAYAARSYSVPTTTRFELPQSRRDTAPALPSNSEDSSEASPQMSPTIVSNALFDYPPERSRPNSEQTSVPGAENGPTNTKGETMLFQAPPNVILTIVSSTRAMIAFIAPHSAVVSTLYSPYSNLTSGAFTIPSPSNCLWEKAALAGNFLALRGYCRLNNTQPFHLYKLSGYNSDLQISELQVQEPSSFEKFTVSRDGRILFGGTKRLWLYQYASGPAQELRAFSVANQANLRQVWFSTNGLLAFAWFSLPGNRHRIRIWDVTNVGRTGTIDHQIPPSDNSGVAVKRMIYFPQSPVCLVWKEHDIVFLLQRLTTANSQRVPHSPNFKHLQAVVVTPNEKAIVFIRSSKSMSIRGIRLESKISVGQIVRNNDYRSIGHISPEETLLNYLDKPSTCDVVIEEHSSSDTHVRVLIAHSNGKFEIKILNYLL